MPHGSGTERSQCSPLPPLTLLPPPQPPCQKPPPPWSFFIISLGCDLHKRGAGTTSWGDGEKMRWFYPCNCTQCSLTAVCPAKVSFKQVPGEVSSASSELPLLIWTLFSWRD
ncbi:hypothetical protein PAMP_015061 [Pampus punctatissimus]